jgi:hypothetical protein
MNTETVLGHILPVIQAMLKDVVSQMSKTSGAPTLYESRGADTSGLVAHWTGHPCLGLSKARAVGWRVRCAPVPVGRSKALMTKHARSRCRPASGTFV